MFELFQQPFLQYAFLAGTAVAIIAAVIGYFVVLRAQAFAAHAFSHIGFAGATAAALLGMSPFIGTVGITLLAALGMSALEKRLKGRDLEIGMMLSFVLGLGVLFLHLYTNSATETVSILFGSIFTVTPNDVWLTVVFAGGILLALGMLFRPLLFISIDPDVAEAKGVPVRLVSALFLLLLAVTVAETIQVIGVLLVFALLVAPAAIAQHLTYRPFVAIFFAILLSLLFTWGGLLFSILTPYPVSFAIACFAAATYFVVIHVRHGIAPHQKEKKVHPNREVRWN